METEVDTGQSVVTHRLDGAKIDNHYEYVKLDKNIEILSPKKVEISQNIVGLEINIGRN